jgi:ParB-like chromosome segregation protein Spo0J
MQQKTVVKALATEMWAIDRIVPYARNPRSNDGAVERMVAAIREFGFKIPLLVLSTGELIDGHLRLKAAKKLNLDEVPVILRRMDPGARQSIPASY